MKNKIKEILGKSIRMLAVTFIVCLGYKICVPGIVAAMVITVFVNMRLLEQGSIRKHHLDRFNDAVLYMEQILYSFKKQPKITRALSDAQKVCSPDMSEVIEEALLKVESGDGNEIYGDALKIIQQEYDCRRIRNVHEFIIKIEENGGEYEKHLDLLLEDVRSFSDMTMLFMKKVDRIRRNVVISIGATLITCGFMSYLLPEGYSYTSNIIYQIFALMTLTGMLFVYYLIEKKMNFDWLAEENALQSNMIVKYYAVVEKHNKNPKSMTWMEKASYKKVKKRLEREIMKEFPNWIRDVAINLQNDTVQSAIERSYAEAAYVLKKPIRSMLLDFEKFPVGIEPYDNFLKGFDVPEVKSSVKMFYSLNELGKEQSEKQIDAVIERNNKMLWQAEEMKNSDRIGLASMVTMAPSLIGTLFLIVQLMLTIVVFTSSIGQAVSGV